MTVDVDIIEQQTPVLDEFPPQVEDGRPPEASCDVESKMKVRSSMEKKADALGAKRGPRFIIAHTWPKLHNAEYEVLQRLSRAATNIGATMIAVDNEGHPLWANNEIPLDTSKPIDPAEIDFMISLHFESPRLIDVYSYYALWQPLQFYFDFGYEGSLKKMLSHNDCLTCRSDLAEAHARTVFGPRGGLNPEPFPTLFHNAPQPYLEPKINSQSRLFYIGINWEKAGGPKGRHDGVLKVLNDGELLDIYGPRKLLHFEPWEGYKCYRGELPFDGLSAVKAINEAGICLALSSEAHKRNGLMSNRLFEGLAAGAAVIADSNSFAKKHFGDIAYFVDDNGSADDVALQIKAIVEDIRRDPEKAMDRVRRGQERLADGFSLEGSLRKLIEGHPARLEYYKSAVLGSGSVSVIIAQRDDSLDGLLNMISQAATQTQVSVHVVLVCDRTFFNTHKRAINAAARGSIRKLVPILLDLASGGGETGQPFVQLEPTGPSVAQALESLDTDYFCFLRDDELWFQDHLASLVGAMQRKPGAVMSVSGVLEQWAVPAPVAENDGEAAVAGPEAAVDSGPSERITRMVVDLRCALNDGRLLDGYCAAEYGRFLFARSVVGQTPLACLSVLDGQEPNLIRMIATLHGDPGQTGYATYVRDRDKTAAQPPSVIPAYAQHQYVRDAVAFDSRWLSRLSQLSPPPSPPAAPAPARSFATKVKGRLKRIAKAALGRV